MTDFRHCVRRTGAVGLIAVSLSLSGCGGFDGVDFNGKIFDAVGLSGSNPFKKDEPVTQARAPLVLPPDGEPLPPPGSAPPPAPALADAQWPKDPDQQKVAQADAKKAAQQKYCKEDGNWKQKAVNDEVGASQGPGGSCNGSIFTVISESLFGKKDE
jgi:hypothetical protein